MSEFPALLHLDNYFSKQLYMFERCCGLVGRCCGLVGKCCGLVGKCCDLVGRCCDLVGRCFDLVGRCCDLVGRCCDLVGRCFDLVGRCFGLVGSFPAPRSPVASSNLGPGTHQSPCGLMCGRSHSEYCTNKVINTRP